MNRLIFLFFVLLLTTSGLRAQVQYATESPRVDDVNDRDVTIQRVELTAQYTIIYMKFESSERRSSNRGWPFSVPLPNGRGRQLESPNTSNIGFQPTARLYVNEGERSYKLIRAENMPAETRRPVAPGERVDFVAYFERVDPGYTTFDLFECRDGGGYVCFNFWGVHIINPLKKTYSQQKPKVPVQPRVQQPRYQPRTTPGAGTPGVGTPGAGVPNSTPPTTQPQPQATPSSVAINGVTRDAKTKGLMAATVSYRLISAAESAGDGRVDSVRSNRATGAYTIPVDRRGVYVITASAKGYFTKSDTLATNRTNVNLDFDLVPIVAGATITLKNIYFNASEFDLKPESYPELDRIAIVMQENPTMTIRLEGHTDTVGDFDANVELSRNRVNEVKRYLVAKGISAGRIDTVGYGPSRPINKNKSLKERPENRRVEMAIIKV